MEKETVKQFVTVPNTLVESPNVSPKSLVIYCALKRFMNKDTMSCYPSKKTIAELCGCSEKTVQNALDELVEAEFITINKRVGTSNEYIFSKSKTFEPFSYDFLDDPKIKLREKAYLIAQQKNMFIHEDVGVTSLTTKEIAKRTHMSESTVLRCENALIKAGYLAKPNSNIIDTTTGLNEKFRLFLLELYNTSALVFRQTQHNTEEIELLKKENAELKRQIEILKRAVFKDSDPNIVL